MRLLPLAIGLVGCGGGVDTVSDAAVDGTMGIDASFDSPDDSNGSDAGNETGISDATSVANPCDAGYCTSSKGECLSISESVCGNFGDTCEACDVDAGYFCKGACFRSQPNCNPSNCVGCCASTSYCSTGTHDIACGNAGLPCERCVPSEGTGQCVPRDGGGGGVCTKPPACSPATCKGCCVGNVCAVGTQDIACGSGGAACEDCNFFFKEKCISNKCQ